MDHRKRLAARRNVMQQTFRLAGPKQCEACRQLVVDIFRQWGWMVDYAKGLPRRR